ncbi:OLC1v1023810C1 [Oldenlandia corymbosa var. corymbosa]|uniref:OLC1v1023810C1 n=1 Tax=Oldenlandia corymbosa var. corymbosa TaxID=529605 RepID=A0AAV1C3V0_OLDCO|nr:OLC1v1023810C1 [Oldenlandia corymbosa var. corymbosa]
MKCLNSVSIFKAKLTTSLRSTFCTKYFPAIQTPFNINNHFSSTALRISARGTNSSQTETEQVVCWSGLESWRTGPLNHNRFWGPNGPESPSLQPSSSFDLGSCSSLAEMGAIVLSTADPLEKSKLSHMAYTRWSQEGLPIGVHEAPSRPARPEKPQLVSPKDIPSPKHSDLPLNAYLLHNLAHVELNAIDLAWDTVVRFSPYSELLGEGFFGDFAHVADDESRHFAWCLQRLAELGFSYGDMPAHNLLWRECNKTSDNVAARLAAIPLVQEARGLDAGPRLVQKLVGFGDLRTSKIVAKIADEELAHVAVGLYWFLSVCQKMGRAPCSAFKDLLREYNVELKGPFNYSARDEAGIPRDWYDPSFSSQNDKNRGLSQVIKRDIRDVLWGWRLPATGLLDSSTFCFSFSNRFHCGHHRLGCRHIYKYHMPMLHLRDALGGIRTGVDQSASSCYGVVRLSHTLLRFDPCSFPFRIIPPRFFSQFCVLLV